MKKKLILVVVIAVIAVIVGCGCVDINYNEAPSSVSIPVLDIIVINYPVMVQFEVHESDFDGEIDIKLYNDGSAILEVRYNDIVDVDDSGYVEWTIRDVSESKVSHYIDEDFLVVLYKDGTAMFQDGESIFGYWYCI